MARIALIGENSVSYVKELLDIWNSGNCAVLIDWRIPFKTALRMMEEANVNECRIEKRVLNEVRISKQSKVNFTPFDSNHITEIVPQYIFDNFKPNYSKEEAVVIYSSGTTGKSKGIILSHYAINTNADSIIDYMYPTEKDCIYIAKTISHSSTLTGELLVALKRNIKIVIGPVIVPPRYVLKNIGKYEVTIICVNPTLLELYAKERYQKLYDLSTLRVIYVSGSVLSDKIYHFAHEIFSDIPIYNVYGLSEAGPRVTAQSKSYSKSNSVGRMIKFVEVVIVDSNGRLVENGVPGIIHVNTPCKYKGYIIGKEKNKSLYNNWINTGDIGYFDENNELHIVNRIDDVIIINSHKIYPSEIEKQIINNTQISECVIVKFEIHSIEFIGCLYTGRCFDYKEIKERLKDNLLSYEIPRYFVHTSHMPRTNTGKIITSEVKKIIKKTIMGEFNE